MSEFGPEACALMPLLEGLIVVVLITANTRYGVGPPLCSAVVLALSG